MSIYHRFFKLQFIDLSKPPPPLVSSAGGRNSYGPTLPAAHPLSDAPRREGPTRRGKPAPRSAEWCTARRSIFYAKQNPHHKKWGFCVLSLLALDGRDYERQCSK